MGNHHWHKIAKRNDFLWANANGIDFRDFSGISTAIQVQSQIKDTDLTLHRYLPYKGAQSIFAFLLGMFLPIKKQAVSVSGQIPTATPPDLSNYPYPLWSLGVLFLMILSLVLLRILHWKRTRVSLH